MTYTQPLILLLGAIALFSLLRLRRCKGWLLPVCAVSALLLLCWAPVAWLLSRPLEDPYPIRPFQASGAYQAIVVLSSGVSPAQFERPYALPDEETFDRCRFAAWVYAMRPVPVLTSGGGAASPDQPSFAATMRAQLLREGIPDAMVWTEERSTSTHENAVFSSQILTQRGVRTIALVADATSMPRASACFRRQGIQVIPAVSGFYEPEYPMALVPGWRAIRQNEFTLHEWVGLCWYRLHGWV